MKIFHSVNPVVSYSRVYSDFFDAWMEINETNHVQCELPVVFTFSLDLSPRLLFYWRSKCMLNRCNVSFLWIVILSH